MFDLLIKNGTIIDGSGEKEKFPANLAVHKGKIHKIGKLRGAVAKKTIDASGCYVTPGFVDIQNHSDSYWTLFTLPSQDSLIAQGITTILGGNCGSSLAPLVDAENIKTIQKWTPPQQLAINWLTLQEFLKQLKNQGIGVNFASLIGHATLRRGLLRDEVRSITKEEVGQMVEMLKDALKQGGFGLSSGLVYTHAKIAETDELIQLVQQIGSQLYASHIRGEGEELIPAVKETLKIAQKTKAQVEISHLKALGQKNWPKMSRALHLIEEAREKGAQINFDIYPYTFTGSVLYILLPDWVAEGGKVAFLPRLRDPVIRAKVIKEMKEDMDYDFSQVKVKGKTLSGPEEIIDILLAQEGRGFAFIEGVSEENIQAGLKHDLSYVCTNGFGCSLSHPEQNKGPVHPRCFGAMPRFLARYVRDGQLMNWEAGIHKISAGPAQKIGLKKRGLLKKNNFADITIFNPQAIKDKATFDNPFQKPEGIKYVIVNGKVVIEEGEQKDELAGQILRNN